MATTLHPEVVLVVFAEAEIDCGLAMLRHFVQRNAYSAAVVVCTDGSAPLADQVKNRLDESVFPKGFKLLRRETSTLRETEELFRNPSLLLLLAGGLEQLDDVRTGLLTDVHTTIVCFETHQQLLEPPQKFAIYGDDPRAAARWVAEHWNTPASFLRYGDSDEEKNTNGMEVGADLDVCMVSIQNHHLASSRKHIKRLIEQLACPVVLIRGEVSWFRWMGETVLPGWTQRIVPQMSREERQTLADTLSTYSKLDVEFIALICCATFLAAFGLVQNSAAVIIGAMLVAPLMTPILGAGLSLAQGNRPLFASSLRTIAFGFVAALTTSFLFGLLLQAAPGQYFKQGDFGVQMTGEMWSRTNPTLIDFLVGLVGGAAAAFARTRSHLSSALAGAAIAAALVPPIATSGLQLSLIFHDVAAPDGSEPARNLVYGPALLFVANMLTIMVGSSFLLWACGVRGERGDSLMQRWSTRTIMLLLIITAGVAVWIAGHP